jgi:hypothetical protein
MAPEKARKGFGVSYSLAAAESRTASGSRPVAGRGPTNDGGGDGAAGYLTDRCREQAFRHDLHRRNDN